MSRKATRRRWLRLTGTGAVGVLVGCMSGGDSSKDGGSTADGGTSTDDGTTDDGGTNTTGTGTTTGDETTAGPTDGEPVGYSMFQYDDGRTGYASGVEAPTAGVTDQWHIEIGDAYDPTSAVVANGTVYLGASRSVYALSAGDGSENWSSGLGTFVRTAPTVVHDTVYVGGETAVAALDAADGSERWSRSADGGRSANGTVTSPVVTDDTVYVNPADGPLLALSAADGSVQWRFNANDRISAAPAVGDGTVYIGSWDENLYALNAADGSVQWTFEAGEAVKTTPAIGDGTVYIGSDDGKVYAVPTGGGREQWSYEVTDGATEYMDDVTASPAVADGTVYVATRLGVHAIGARDGSERWVVEPEGSVYAPPMVADNTVYIGDTDGLVYAFGTDDGSVRWRFDTAGPLPMETYTSGGTTTPEPQEPDMIVQTTPSVANGTLYVVATKNEEIPEVYALVEA